MPERFFCRERDVIHLKCVYFFNIYMDIIKDARNFKHGESSHMFNNVYPKQIKVFL